MFWIEISTNVAIARRQGVLTHSIVRVQTCPVKRPDDASTLQEWIVLARLSTGKGFGNTKVNEFDYRRIVQCAKKVLRFDVTVHDAERVDVLQCCELRALSKYCTKPGFDPYALLDPRFE
jgi:hypothetical protein